MSRRNGNPSQLLKALMILALVLAIVPIFAAIITVISSPSEPSPDLTHAGGLNGPDAAGSLTVPAIDFKSAPGQFIP